MNFNSDLIIKGESAKKFNEIKDQFSFTFMDIFLYSSMLGIDNNVYVENIDEKESQSIVPASISRTMIVNNVDIINNLAAIAFIKHHENDLNDGLIKLAFEDKDEDYKNFERFKCIFNYAMGGVNILYTMLKPNDGVVRDEITILNGILDKYKGV